MHLARVVPDAAHMTPANVSGPGVPHPQGRRYRSAVRFQLLGPLVVSGDDGPIAIGGPKQRLVLAHLLLRANTTVPTDRLADAVWGEEPPETARATLQTYVSRLRGLIGSERIYGQPRGYRFSAVPEELDTLRFETLLKEAHEDGFGPKAALDVLNEALDLWRGPALADLADEPSLSGEIARLEELRLQATEEKIETELDLGRHGDAVVELETLTRAHPLRERLWGELMLALYRAGRQADALSAFDQARSILSEELGIDPSNELQHLHERILRHDPDLDLTGEPLRGYPLLEQIGEGAFGVVYRAIQPQVHRDVAVKAIPPHLANDPEFIRRFEAAVLGGHPGRRPRPPVAGRSSSPTRKPRKPPSRGPDRHLHPCWPRQVHRRLGPIRITDQRDRFRDPDIELQERQRPRPEPRSTQPRCSSRRDAVGGGLWKAQPWQDSWP